MNAPLADRIRPKTLDDVVGQQHILGPNKVLRRIIESGTIPNMVFYGPSGVGKTTVASIIAKQSHMHLCKLNGTTASTADIRDVVAQVNTLQAVNGVLLYLDEIQYFNKKQQQTLLEFIENGSITLIASTTENPYFYVYNAILSRSTVFEFKPVEKEEVARAVDRAFRILSEDRGEEIRLEDGVTSYIASACGGDVRKAMNAAELCTAAVRSEDEPRITMELAEQLTQRSAMRYDRDSDAHYDILSAFQIHARLRPRRGAALSRTAFGSGRSRLCMPPLDGVRLRRRGPCVATDHPHRESGRRCRHDGRSAGSAHPACGCRHFNGDGAEIEQR